MVKTIETVKLKLNPAMQLVLIGLFFFLPFERIPTIDLGLYTVKISYLFGLIILGFTARRLVPLLRRQPLQRADLALLGFWLAGLASLFLSPSFKHSLVIFAMWTFMFLLYLALSRLISAGSYPKIEKAVMAATVIVCLFGIYQFLGDSYGLSTAWTGLRIQYTKVVFGFPRIQSVGLEPLYFGDFLLVPLLLIMARYAQMKSFLNKYFYLLVLVLTNIILGIARGVYAAAAVAVIIFLIYLLVKAKKYVDYRRQAAGIVLAGVLAGVAAFCFVQFANGGSAVGNFVDHAAVVSDVRGGGESVVGRVANFKFAWKLFREKPILGQGVGSYGVLSTDPRLRVEGGYGVVNNEYLEILAETGVIGFVLFALFLIWYLRDAIRAVKLTTGSEQTLNVALLLGLAGIFIQYNFFSTLYIIHLWVFLALVRARTNQQSEA